MKPIPFSCDTANVALGFPNARVSMCMEMSALKGIFLVGLDGAELPNGQIGKLVAAENGVLLTGRGGREAAAFLRRSKVWDLPTLSRQEMLNALSAFGACPAGFELLTAASGVPGDTAPDFVVNPFKMLLVVGLERYRGPSYPSGAAGGATHPFYVRATLTGGPSTPFTWVVEQGDRSGPWTEIAREAWE